MTTPSSRYSLAVLLVLNGAFALPAQDSNGLAPEVADLNAAAVSYALEAKLPDLPKAYLSVAPKDLRDGTAVGVLGVDGGDKDAVLKFTREIEAGEHGEIDSLLIAHHGKLLFESYYRRGRLNYPHYQMSITKSYTAMAIGRAIQLGHLTMADLDKPVVGFLKNLRPAKLVTGAKAITLSEAMNMHSGVRLDEARVAQLVKDSAALKGQGQIQAYLEHSAPIPDTARVQVSGFGSLHDHAGAGGGGSGFRAGIHREGTLRQDGYHELQLGDGCLRVAEIGRRQRRPIPRHAQVGSARAGRRQMAG